MEQIPGSATARNLAKGRRGQLAWAGRHWPIEVLAVADDTVGVAFPSVEPLGLGALVNLEFQMNGWGALYFMHVVVPPQAPGDGMILRRAASVTYVERRRTWRVPIHAPLVFVKKDVGEPLEGQMIDLSAEGALIETTAPLEIADIIDLRVQTEGTPGALVSGRVVRIVYDEFDEAAPPRYGIWFTEMATEARSILTQFLWARIRVLYPREIAALFPGSGRRKRAKQKRESGDPAEK